MITVQGVTKRYGELKAVSDLNFAIGKGEIVGLLGQNGAGKTTCMKMITGYLEPTAGSINVDGFDVIKQRIQVQGRVGYLPEHAPLYPEMRVEEYIQFIAELRGLRGKKKRKAVEEALESTGLLARRHQEIATLSKGYKQRVGLAQAIVHKPSILILDEPTNGLDPVQIQEIRTLIKGLAQNTTILLSTHILSEIEAMCDRVVILIDGELVSDSSLDELLTRTSITLQVAQVKELEKVLIEQFETLESVQLIKSDEGRFDRYLVKTKEDVDSQALVAEIAEFIVKKAWKLGGISVETQSLESAFRELMSAHVERALASE